MLRSREPTLEVHPPRGGRALLYVGNISGIQKYSSLLADANKIRSQNGFALCEGRGLHCIADGCALRCNVRDNFQDRKEVWTVSGGL